MQKTQRFSSMALYIFSGHYSRLYLSSCTLEQHNHNRRVMYENDIKRDHFKESLSICGRWNASRFQIMEPLFEIYSALAHSRFSPYMQIPISNMPSTVGSFMRDVIHGVMKDKKEPKSPIQLRTTSLIAASQTPRFSLTVPTKAIFHSSSIIKYKGTFT